MRRFPKAAAARTVGDVPGQATPCEGSDPDEHVGRTVAPLGSRGARRQDESPAPHREPFSGDDAA